MKANAFRVAALLVACVCGVAGFNGAPRTLMSDEQTANLVASILKKSGYQQISSQSGRFRYGKLISQQGFTARHRECAGMVTVQITRAATSMQIVRFPGQFTVAAYGSWRGQTFSRPRLLLETLRMRARYLITLRRGKIANAIIVSSGPPSCARLIPDWSSVWK